MEAVQNFNNPFRMADSDKLHCISSGAPATTQVEDDMLRAEAAGMAMKKEFIEKRLKSKDHFFEPIKKVNLKTMAEMNKTVKLKSSQNKSIVYKQQGDSAFKLLVKSQIQPEKLDLKKLMTFPLVPVPYSIRLPGNFLAKTDKAKAYQYVAKDFDDASIPENPNSCLVIEDGNAIFHQIKDLPRNFDPELILKVALHKSPVIFSTDMYNDHSIKNSGRKRRGCGEKLIVRGGKTIRPKNCKGFLMNDENKEQLIQVMLDTWGSDAFSQMLHGHDVTLICQGKAYHFYSDGKSTVTEEVASLESTQEETDSRVILYCLHASSMHVSEVLTQTFFSSCCTMLNR